MAQVIRDVAEMQATAAQIRASGQRIGVVPTMGFLHEGHLSLIRLARQHSDVVITTIFVNPAQFGPSEDFNRYPRDLDRDKDLAFDAGSNYVFAPDTGAMYPDGYTTYVNVERMTTSLEGKSRPGHFRGVATIVAKLFNITRPHCAVFGQKDAQQVIVVRQMVRDLNFDIEIIVAPTVRERDGLAMSSRNSYLTLAQRKEATVLYGSLAMAEDGIRSGERESKQIVRKMTDLIASSSGIIDYISVADGTTLDEVKVCEPGRPILISLAVRFGATRLIDNIALTV
ncbi:MAG TPA: pantoate--beta-alanine ligase [Bacteroidota bacterium]|nr:pantoate--beta-alanine ligase [Bacteroidota bacterium]